MTVRPLGHRCSSNFQLLCYYNHIAASSSHLFATHPTLGLPPSCSLVIPLQAASNLVHGGATTNIARSCSITVAIAFPSCLGKAPCHRNAAEVPQLSNLHIAHGLDPDLAVRLLPKLKGLSTTKSLSLTSFLPSVLAGHWGLNLEQTSNSQ